MYTIKQAAELTGVPSAKLRAWESRYGVPSPTRSESGYRFYDKDDIADIIGLRTLVEAGWTPAEGARAIQDGTVQPGSTAATELSALPWPHDPPADAAGAFTDFLRAAASLDSAGLEASLDRGFALGSFETVIESWLFPTLTALGDGWALGKIDVAGEHLASRAVRVRLSAAFEAAGWRSRGPSVLVGLPPGNRHELAALAFAVTAKRRGLDVRYLGADVSTASWVEAVDEHRVDAAVLAVGMNHHRPAAEATARALLSSRPGLVVAVGGPYSAGLAPGVLELPSKVTAAADQLDDLLHRTAV